MPAGLLVTIPAPAAGLATVTPIDAAVVCDCDIDAAPPPQLVRRTAESVDSAAKNKRDLRGYT